MATHKNNTNLSFRKRLAQYGHRLEPKLMGMQWRSKTIDFLSFLLEPLWAAQAVPARVLAVDAEANATHLWLRPAMRWSWPTAGQFISVTFEHAGELVQRCYSVSGFDQAQDRFRITICTVPGGLVSEQVVPNLKVGDVLRISAAAGDFVLPKQPAAVWLWGAGSGITPMLPLAEQALANGQAVNVLYLCRGQDQAPLSAEWLALGERYSQHLTLQYWNTATAGRPSEATLAKRITHFASDAHGYICGPQGFIQSARSAALAAGLPEKQLHIESFENEVAPPQSELEAREVVAKVNLSDGREIAVRAGQTILQAAQAAGVMMPSCCGQGVCRSCETRKISGVVENIQTGLKQLREGEWILPCVSTPLGDVELAV